MWKVNIPIEESWIGHLLEPPIHCLNSVTDNIQKAKFWYLKKECGTHTMEYYCLMKMNKLLIYANLDKAQGIESQFWKFTSCTFQTLI